MDKIKQIAIIGSTASGKTSLAIELAKKTNSVILSLDSLAIYKYVDIVSAKPLEVEQDGIKHFGLSQLEPDQKIDVINFISYYYRALEYAKDNQKNLIIVGGTSFYLKIMCDGISRGVVTSEETKEWLDDMLNNLPKAYQFLNSIDKTYSQKISQNDKYRIEKALSIYRESGLTPTKFFEQNGKKKIFEENIPIFELQVDRDIIRKNIEIRTQNMLLSGLIDEVLYLEKRYNRDTNVMKSIGVVECLDYLDGKIDRDELYQKIVTNTYRLAKRQNTYNKSQFNNKQILGDKETIMKLAKEKLV
jgi:tRNA dimethylallyltransferase